MRADEHQLRLALRQQVKHNEQQNLIMTRMSSAAGQAGRLVDSLGALVKKVENGKIGHEDFFTKSSDLLRKFNKASSRGTPKEGRS